MAVIFDNPAGGFALLGVPALIAIHLLQSRSRRTPVSTLFLLDRLAPESRGGLRLQKLRRSLPLLLRCLAVIALAWVLSAPRFVRPESSQRIAVVLDASLSMDAALPRLRAALPARLARLTRYATRTEWLVTESDLLRPVVYHGDDLAALAGSLQSWRPMQGDHDVTPALVHAAATVRDAGVVVFVTDRPAAGRVGSAALAYGAPVENRGFVGASVEPGDRGPGWSALVRNHGRERAALSWTLTADGAPVSQRPLTLAPGETATLSGDFPPGVSRLLLTLPADGFTVDDTLPLVRPEPQRIRVANLLDGVDGKVVDRLLAGVPGVVRASDPSAADLRYARGPAGPVADPVPTVYLAAAEAKAVATKGVVLSEDHAFTADASWQGLVAPYAAGSIAADTDRTLVWRGSSPLVALRPGAVKGDSLLVDFSTASTNAGKIPAFVVLLRRHLESVRAKLAVPYAINTDTHRLLPSLSVPAGAVVTLRTDDAPPVPVSSRDAAVLRSPARPGFFEVAVGGVTRVTGAAQFGDAREADFSACAEADTLDGRERTLAHASSVPDPWRAYWLASLAALLLAAWWLQRDTAESGRSPA